MAQKIKLILYPVFCFILFLFASCEKDNLEHNKSNGKLKITHRSFEELIKEQPFGSAINKVLKAKAKKRKTTHTDAKTAVEDQYGFTIADSPVKIVMTDSLTSYSMLITRESQQPDYFENLVVQVDHHNKTTAILLKYTPESTPITWPLQGRTQVTPILYPKSTTARGSATVCVTTITYNCENASPTHVPGEGSCEAPPIRTRECYTYFIDYDYSDPYDDGGGSSSGGGGDNNDTPGEEAPIVTAPVDPSTDFGGGQSAPKTPCGELKKLALSAPFKHAIHNLEPLAAGQTEKGWALQTFNNSNVIQPPQALMPDPKNPNHVNVASKIGGNYFGALHCHTDPESTGGVPMFSGDDVYGLALLALRHNNNGQPKEYPFYIVTLTIKIGVKNTTMAIKIKDWNTLYNAVNTTEKLTILNQTITRSYEQLGFANTLENYQKDFLNLVNSQNLGVTLYEANDDLSGWSEVTKDSSGHITKTPC